MKSINMFYMFCNLEFADISFENLLRFEDKTWLFSCLCMSMLTSNSSGNMQKRRKYILGLGNCLRLPCLSHATLSSSFSLHTQWSWRSWACVPAMLPFGQQSRTMERSPSRQTHCSVLNSLLLCMSGSDVWYLTRRLLPIPLLREPDL